MTDTAAAGALEAERIPHVLSIAGTDPTGGAGLHADLKSIAANGGYGMAAVTAVVAQNTCGVRSVHTPGAGVLRGQLQAVADDVRIDAVKIGMLPDRAAVEAVSDWLRESLPPVVVLDPVMVATSGDRLLEAEAQAALRALLPQAHLVTPNVPELAVLVGAAPAESWAAALHQARLLAARDGVMVLAKGGHLADEAARDALVAPDGHAVEFCAPRVGTANTHGTGCSLSSAIATQQARHGDWEIAVDYAKLWLTESLAAADTLQVGAGHGPISHFSGLWSRAGTLPAAGIARQWWRLAESVREKIDRLPFVRGLTDGTLDASAFAWYLRQDRLYLREYARALATASALAPTVAEQAFWARGAHTALTVETGFHDRHTGDAVEPPAPAPAPATTAYTDHLLAASSRGRYEELVAAVLPCYWVYADLGERLAARIAPDNPYAEWIATYAAADFVAATRQAVAIASACAASAAPGDRERMCRAFLASTRHEHDFFAAPLSS